MERDPDGRLLVVTESSFLINFLAIDRMDILAGLHQFKFCVLDHVKAEIQYPDQQARLQAAVAAGIVSELEITEPPEILLYDGFRKFLGDEEYLLDTPGTLVAAIKGGVISIPEAEELRNRLREHRFEMDPRPFEEFLREE